MLPRQPVSSPPFLVESSFTPVLKHNGRPFLRRLRALLGPRGRVAVNLFFDRREHERAMRIAMLFDIYKTHRVGGNVIIHARRRGRR